MRDIKDNFLFVCIGGVRPLCYDGTCMPKVISSTNTNYDPMGHPRWTWNVLPFTLFLSEHTVYPCCWVITACAALLQGSDIVCCSVVKLAQWLLGGVAEGAHAFLGEAISHYTGCGDLVWLSDKGSMGPWDPNHANSPNRLYTMDSPKIETTGKIVKFEKKQNPTQHPKLI